MNKIILEEELITRLKKTEIEISYHKAKSLFDINKVNLKIKKNCNLLFEVNKFEDLKLDLVIDVSDNVSVFLNMINILKKAKIKTTINLGINSYISIDKINDCDSAKEGLILNLNGELAKADYNFKSVATSNETYDIVVNHQASKTESMIKNNIINYTGNVLVQVSTYIDKDYIETKADQKNTIINLANKKCEIKPNLFIDSFDSLANHSAYIGRFSQDKIFYLMSRGLSEKESTNLLIKGFLESDVEDKKLLRTINKIIKNYWR